MNLKTNKVAKLEGWVSISLNALLFLLKLTVGLSISSVAIMADAWHTLSDSLSSLVLLAGVKLSEKPPDKEHPYGHGRFQLLATFTIGIMLAIVGIDFLTKAIHEFTSPTYIQFGTSAIAVTIISVIIKEALAQFSIWGAKKEKSKALKAEGWHHRSDALSSLIILIGIMLNKIIPHIDAILGIFVAICILYAAYEVFKTIINSFLGTTPSEEITKAINTIAFEETNMETNPHHFHLHEYGGHLELTFHIFLPPDMPLQAAHSLVDNIENRIKDELNIYPTIHSEPDRLCKQAI